LQLKLEAAENERRIKEEEERKELDRQKAEAKRTKKEQAKEAKKQKRQSESNEEPKLPEPMVEQLVVDVAAAPADNNHEGHKMKSSVDSGVDVNCLRSSQKCSSNESIEETPNGTPTNNNPSKLAAKQAEILEQITQFVTYAQEKLSNTQIVHSEAPRKVFQFQMPQPLLPRKPPVKRERAHKLLPQDVEYCVYMLETYGDDYEVSSPNSL
jgi:hypothetical protein